MKKYAIFALMLVLTAAVLAGCRKPNMDATVAPTQTVTMPTVTPTIPPATEPATKPATKPTTEPTIGEGGTMPTDETGTAGSTEVPGSTAEGRSRTPRIR